MKRGTGLCLCVLALLVTLGVPSSAQLAGDDLKNFDGTWEGRLHAYQLAVDGSSFPAGQSEDVRLVIRRTPSDLQTKNARGEWESTDSVALSSLFKYEASTGALVGRFLRTGADNDGRWVEHQTLYVTHKDRSTIVVYWLRAVNNLDLALTNSDSKWGRLRVAELRRIP